MDKTFRTFDSHEDADRASQEDDSKLSTQERLANFLKMMAPVYGSGQRFQRVLRTRNLDEPEVRDQWRVDQSLSYCAEEPGITRYNRQTDALNCQ